MTTPSRRPDDSAARFEERKRWLTAWIGLLAMLFLVPAFLIAREQRASRIFEAGSVAPYRNDWMVEPTYTKPSMMPTARPAFLRPPKSMLAVPESMPCTPMMASDMSTTTHPMRPVGMVTNIASAPTIITP
jgi:hypothetical protein